MGRRANNTGTIVKRKDGRYQGSIQVDGVRRTVYGKTKSEVSRKIDELRSQIMALGTLPNPGKRTISDLLDAWLTASSSSLGAKTMMDYMGICERHIKPAIGSVRISRIDPYHVQQLYSALESEGMRRIPSQVHAILHRAFRFAVLWRWLSDNPCDRVIKPSYNAERKQMWDHRQVEMFVSEVQNHWLGPLWITLIGVGCRIGEATALRWADIDGTNLHVRRNLQRVDGKWITGKPKTEAGNRCVLLPDMVMNAFRRQRSQQAEWRLRQGMDWPDTDLIFTTRQGTPLHRSVVGHSMRKVCEFLSIPRLTPHGLRHLSASVIVAQGIPLPAVSKRLGHSRTSITLDTYSHVIGGEDEAAAKVLDRVIGGVG